MAIFFSFELAAFELANKLITIASEHCIAFEHSLTKGRLGGIVDEVVQDRDAKLRPKFPETGFPVSARPGNPHDSQFTEKATFLAVGQQGPVWRPRDHF
jgi:hypothetical protein